MSKVLSFNDIIKCMEMNGSNMSAFYFFVQGIPECMGVIALSLAYAKVPLRWGYIFMGGVLIAVVNYIIRSLPFTFGFHLPVMTFLIFLLMVRFTNSTLSRTIIAVFSSFVTLAVLEYFVSSAYFAYSHMDPQQVIANEGLWATIGVIQAVILNVIAFVVAHFLKPTKGAWKNELSGIQQ